MGRRLAVKGNISTTISDKVAPLFGVNGVVGIGHGKANHQTVEKAINSIILWIKSNMIEEMNKEINQLSTEKTNEKQ